MTHCVFHIFYIREMKLLISIINFIPSISTKNLNTNIINVNVAAFMQFTVM